MRDFRAGRVARSTWIDSCSRDRQVCASAASSARSSKGSVRSMELQHTNSIDQQPMLPLVYVWQLVTDCLKQQACDAFAARAAGQC